MNFDSSGHHPSLPGFCPVEAAVSAMASSSIESRGAVFTRREVVDFILDLTGYTADRPLHEARLLEPSVGQGDFLIPVIERLLEAYHKVPVKARHGVVADLGNCITAVEVHRGSYERTRGVVQQVLYAYGIGARDAEALCDRWLRQGDFLLLPFGCDFTHAIGNPPYVRQELIPDALMGEYRRRYRTIFDRADIYVPFIERALSLLAPGGRLGFICADRWMKNRYGAPLRQLVAENYNLEYFVDMVDTPAFKSEVIAYPAIVVIGRGESKATRIAYRPAIDAEVLRTLASVMRAPTLATGEAVSEVAALARSDEPWMFERPDQVALIRRLETDYPALEDAFCKVGIGVATGADQVFIGRFDDLNVEPDRKLPLAMTRDIASGSVRWRGMGVINPFAPGGGLVSLSGYPKLAAYLERHGAAIKARHVSKKNPAAWYRTIDRIYPDLAARPKLLIPDIKGSAQIVFEPGKLYPHHNLYFVTSDSWDLHALQAVLLSDVARVFILLYSTRMRGGYFRFQAQYLRRIRVPRWDAVPVELREELIRAAKCGNRGACNAAATALYKLTPAERSALAVNFGTADAARSKRL
jgi:hypothetical protein